MRPSRNVRMRPMSQRPRLTRFAWLSIAAALSTMALKSLAFLLTGSIGLLSDALESGVNLAAAILALIVLTVVARPPDEEHAYGHEKAEYFSSGAEGTLILVAAAAIAYKAAERLIAPIPLQQLDLGLVISAAASVINLIVARVLLRVGRRARSIALEADARHLMTDVWTSGAILVGVALVALTHWEPLDPLVAMAAALGITWSGIGLVRRSILGLMDTALPEPDMEAVRTILAAYQPQGVRFHALRSRQSGARSFVSMHIQVPGSWSVQRGHDLLEAIEDQVRQAVPSATVFTHLEPIEDPASWQDQKLDRATDQPQD
jgi:cation diffusion facilitator family transporter